ncbi:MAG TPA: PaaI family thioesterase [Trebonia sp.]|jgi:uncharacterized protein (TIGR00369 family)
MPESPELPDLALAPGEFMRVLGLDLGEVSGSRVTGSLELTPEHNTPWGVVHGGVYTAVIETVASLGASLHVSDRDQFAVGVNNSTDFIRSAPHGRLDVVAVPVQQGRVQQLWEVTLRSGDTLIARGTVRLQNVPLSRAK